MYKRRATIFCAICFLGGIFASAFLNFNISSSFPVFHVSQFYFAGFFVSGLILAQFLGGAKARMKRMAVLNLLLALMFFSGMAAHQNAAFSLPEKEDGVINISDYNNKEKIIFLGSVSNYPDLRMEKTRYEITAIEVIEGDPPGIIRKTNGKVLATANRYPEYKYGDILEISGALKTPAEFPDFDYKNYLAKDGIFSVIYYSKMKKVGEEESIGVIFTRTVFSFREKMRESFYKIFPAPHSSILSAMILGDKSLLSEELKNKLSVTGMRHIVAISGMHIFILIKILETVGFRAGLWRKHIFYFVLVVITLYILMIGSPASAIRAGIMGAVLLLANKTGRVNNPKRIIIFVAAGILALNPLLLKLDIGFQLSFLAILGIMYFEKYFEKLMRFLPETLFSGYFPMRSIAAMSLAAQITTLPVVIYNFGIISFISPIINVLVVPLLSFIMPFAIVAGLGGIIFTELFILLSWPLYLVLSYMILMIDLFSKIPLGFIELSGRVGFLWFLPWYLALFLFYKKYLNGEVEV